LSDCLPGNAAQNMNSEFEPLAVHMVGKRFEALTIG
jgi:hypothetical protein